MRKPSVILPGGKRKKYEGLFHDTIWYEIGESFGIYPQEFMEQVWPWFIDVFDSLARETQPFHNAYRDHHGLTFSGPADESDLFQKAFEQIIQRFAENHSDAFVDFVIDNQGSDLNVVHRLLALGP